MTEEKKTRRRRKPVAKPSKVVDSTVILEKGDVIGSRQEEETSAPSELPPPSDAVDAEVIKTSASRVVAHKDRYTKIVAIQDCVGRNGGIRVDIKAGQTYTFPTAVANWLISIGRAK